MTRIFQSLNRGFVFLCKTRSPIGLSDIFLFGGLCLLGYGLFLYRPWIAFAVCGVLLMAIGLFMGRTEGPAK